MDFSMLNQIFQDNLSIILTVIVVLLVLLIILSIVMLVKLSKAKKRYNSLVNGATGESLEDIIADNIAQMNELVVKNNKIDAENIIRYIHIFVLKLLFFFIIFISYSSYCNY